MAPMHVEAALEVPEYEINPDELDFTQSREISNVKMFLALVNLLLMCSILFSSDGVEFLVFIGNLLYGNVAWHSSCGEEAR